MRPSLFLRSLLPLAVSVFLAPFTKAQTSSYSIPFTSGPIPLCDTVTFTANVGGVGQLTPPSMWNYSVWIQSLTINVTSDHPQGLSISLTSPQGTTLLLSAFNGAGGQNYTNTSFMYDPFYANITTGAAPFNGSWTAQGGGLNAFDYENADGVWTITIIDTLCTAMGGGGGGGGGGVPLMPGYFNGGGGGGFTMAFFSPPPPCMGWINGGSADICSSGTFDLLGYYAAAYPGYAFTFYDPSFTVVANPSAVSTMGTYAVEAYDMMGCYYNAQFMVTASAPISLGPDVVLEQCASAGPIDLTAQLNLAGVTTQAWTLTGASIPGANALAASVSGVYSLIASNAGGCADTAQVTLTVVADPVLGADQVIAVCPGGTADLTAGFNTAGFTASWSYGGASVAPPATAALPGTYTLVATTASAGCTDTADATLTILVPPSLGADQQMDACANSTVDLTTLFGTAGLVAAWTSAGAPVPALASAAPGATYQLLASDAAGCTDTASVVVNALPAPALGADASGSFCAGGQEDLTPYFNTSGLSSNWSFNGSLVSDITAVNTAGTYVLQASNADGCIDTALVLITTDPNPALGPDQSFLLCNWQTVDLGTVFPVGGLNTTYTMNGNPVAAPASVHDPGVYAVQVVDANGCMDTALVTVDTMFCRCTAEFSYDAQCYQDPVPFTLIADSTILAAEWRFGSAAAYADAIDPVVQFVRGGEVVVTLRATLSCGVVEVVRAIQVPDCSDSCTVFVPNAFTPDGDSYNEAWALGGECVPQQFNVAVFDRWGELIYTSADPQKAWDGTVNGRMSPAGVYAYRMEYQLPYQEPKKAHGFITLLR